MRKQQEDFSYLFSFLTRIINVKGLHGERAAVWQRAVLIAWNLNVFGAFIYPIYICSSISILICDISSSARTNHIPPFRVPTWIAIMVVLIYSNSQWHNLYAFLHQPYYSQRMTSCAVMKKRIFATYHPSLQIGLNCWEILRCEDTIVKEKLGNIRTGLERIWDYRNGKNSFRKFDYFFYYLLESPPIKNRAIIY